ncbi:MAG: hypothetical protein EOQ92_29550 [Mesorhizobium sp.]|nr:MAG: hypothetical protein EOQ92_29550 [Mesorhizobium sp.]RWK47005.1 MAG: hypothetical protein EOR47_23755 [Mesorhizobium sp.]RWK91837.1 MAG: hypothetical protein EOR53_27750 [Mesorhizobium sp.]RWL01473.1 MAG: hypothetical protein EOR45_17530 [Mesorhizobium sp.]TIP57290.1 MAG: hypothetical protein E5X56_20665 [Mesorhizobium sp.]
MALPTPVPGLVIRYSYLWLAEHRRGQEEGVKDRSSSSRRPRRRAGTERASRWLVAADRMNANCHPLLAQPVRPPCGAASWSASRSSGCS